MITQNRGIMVKFYSYIDDHEKLKFAVICAKTEGKFVLCKHKMRDTLEFPGGHREAEELLSIPQKENSKKKRAQRILRLSLFAFTA